MASGKARSTRKLRNWVVEQVESGQFPGVCWEDTDKTMFRIPWKHAGKQDFREDQDAAFFKAWAIFKGKYKKGDMEGPATWKTRLRCALNKSPEFEEVPQRGRIDGTEPYKVYRLLPQGTLPAHPEAQKSKRHHSSVCPEREDEGAMKKCRLGSSLLQDPLQREAVEADGGAGRSDFGSSSNSSCSNSNSPEPQKGADTVHASLQREDACLEPVLLPESEPQAEQEDYWEEMPVLWDHPVSIDYSLMLTFIYGGRVVGETQVQSLDCRLVAEPTDTQCGMEQVVFPKPGPQEAAQRLLNQLKRGVLVASNSRGLFVQRLCPIPITWNAPQAPSGPGPHLLPSNECVELFRTACFRRDLRRFSQGLGPAPKFQVTLNFWEKSPGPNHTNDNGLITVQMEQAFARHWLKETAKEQAATLSLVQSLEDPPSCSPLFSLSPLSETVYTPCSTTSLGDDSRCCLQQLPP
ncbi:PREDICTED: interferon regulatory factor 9 [Condylura cristata]|uniref:interferon regulatory factor 9 n=1 Tax=Condylura cristata TaxID=143302 RepID=UPI000642E634|nr:PREDICTED: interferon regulatory factor 9 [Condylura cristata]